MNKKIKFAKTTPNKIKTVPQDTFTASQVGILIEELQGQFKVFGEELQTINRKIDGISANQAWTLERVTALEIGQREILKRLDAVEKEIVSIKAEIKEIKTALKTVVDPTEFRLLENRVGTLEEQVELLLSK